MTIKAGKWEFPIQIVGRAKLDETFDLVTVNINKGAIFVFQTYGNIIMTGWYDGYGGPKLKDWKNVYIWNSEQLNTKGNIKKVFNFNKKDLEVLL